jgi:hypothetical protein
MYVWQAGRPVLVSVQMTCSCSPLHPLCRLPRPSVSPMRLPPVPRREPGTPIIIPTLARDPFRTTERDRASIAAYIKRTLDPPARGKG